MSDISMAFGTNRVFYFYRGRVGLYALLKAMRINGGDEVILQAFTCMAVPIPILSVGAVPVYVDINPKTLNMDIPKIEEKISRKTRAIIVQHTFGMPADIFPILEIAKKHNLSVIEDCCHAFGAEYRGMEVGTFGDAAFHSYEWGKPLVIGLGGTVLVNNDVLAERMKEECVRYVQPSLKELLMINSQYFVHKWILRPGLYWYMKDMYKMLSRAGFIVGTFKESELAGRVSSDYNKTMFPAFKKRLLKKITAINGMIENRVKTASLYEQVLTEHGYNVMKPEKWQKPVYLRYPVLFKKKQYVLEAARKRRVEISDIYSTPVHPLKSGDLDIVKYRRDSCPVAEMISGRIVSLPVNEKIGKICVKRIAHFLKDMKDLYIPWDEAGINGDS